MRPSHAADVGQIVGHDGGEHGTEEQHAAGGAHGQPAFPARPCDGKDQEQNIGKTKGEKKQTK